MTFDELCDRFDCTPKEREELFIFLLSRRLLAMFRGYGK